VSTASFAEELPPGVIDLGERALVGASADSLQIAAWNPADPGTVRVMLSGSGRLLFKAAIASDSDLIWVGYLGKDDFPTIIKKTGQLQNLRKSSDEVGLSLEGGPLRKGVIAVSKDGRRIAFGGDGAKIWDASSGKLVGSSEGTTMNFTSFNDSGERAVFLSDDTAYLWKQGASSIQKLGPKFSDSLFYGIRSQTGRYVAAPSRDRIQIFDLELEKTDYVEASAGATAEFGNTDSELAVIHGADQKHQVDIWSLGGGLDELTFRRNYLSQYESMSTYSDGQVLCCDVESELSVVLHDVGKSESRKLISECGFFARGSDANQVGISQMKMFRQNSRALVATGRGLIGLWDLKAKNVTVTRQYKGIETFLETPTESAVCLGAVSIPSVVSRLEPVGDHGSVITECSSRQVYFLASDVCFPQVGVSRVTFEYGPGEYDGTTLDFSSNGGRVSVATTRAAFVINSKTGNVAQSVKGDYFLGKFDDSDERLFLLGSSSHGLGDLKTGQFFPLGNFGEPTRQLSGKRLVTGFFLDGKSNTHAVVEASTGKLINSIKFESLSTSSVRLSDDGKVLAGVGRRSDSPAGIELVDVASGRTIISMTIEGGFRPFCKSIADGRVVAVANDRGVAFYDVRRRRQLSLIPASQYWLENHPDLDVKFSVVQKPKGYDTPRSDKDDLNSDVLLQDSNFQLRETDICEKRKLCLIAELGRCSIWNYETGALLWLAYCRREVPVQAIFSIDGTKAAVATGQQLQIFDITSLGTESLP
jgi:hypothetical protein